MPLFVGSQQSQSRLSIRLRMRNILSSGYAALAHRVPLGAMDAILKALPWLFRGKLLLLDSPLRQMEWLGPEVCAIRREALARGLINVHHRTRAAMPDERCAPDCDCDLDQTHEGILLFPVIEYSLCMSLEIARHEFNPSIRAHKAEACRWLHYARHVADELLEAWHRWRPRAVAYFQGYFVEAMLAQELAKRYGCQTFALENTFHPDRAICEPRSGVSVNRNSAQRYFELRRLQEDEVPGTFAATLLTRIEATKHPDHRSASTRFSWPAHKRRILFLAQCLTDSSVLFGTRGSFSSLEVIRVLIDIARRHGYFVVVKLHPKEHAWNPLQRPYRNLTYRRLAACGVVSAAPSSNYHLDGDNAYSTSLLIQDAEVVVTINSQGGLEALAYEREVVVLGTAFYDGLDVTWNLSDPHQLEETIERILKDGETRVDHHRINAFLRCYFEDYCVPKSAAGLAEALCSRLEPYGVQRAEKA